jgi:hypothetical protein
MERKEIDEVFVRTLKKMHFWRFLLLGFSLLVLDLALYISFWNGSGVYSVWIVSIFLTMTLLMLGSFFFSLIAFIIATMAKWRLLEI